MKNISLFIFGMLLAIGVMAQQRGPTLSLSYLGAYFVQPGLKLALSLPTKQWTSDKGKVYQLRISPQLGFASQYAAGQHYLLQTDLQLRMQAAGRKRYGSPSFGLAYLFTRLHEDGSISLNDGLITQKTSKHHMMLPTLNYEIGRDWGENFSLFMKGSYGYKMFTSLEDKAFFGFELGLTYHL